jgi:hypothetical protein
MGKYIWFIKVYVIAFKCFMLEEEEFVDLLIDKYEEKRKYVDFLE